MNQTILQTELFAEVGQDSLTVAPKIMKGQALNRNSERPTHTGNQDDQTYM